MKDAMSDWTTGPAEDHTPNTVSPVVTEPFLRPKILVYSHDTFGLGNIKRTLLISRAIKEAYDHAAVLIVTGSPVVQSFEIPDGIDYIKLPSVDRTTADTYTPRFLSRDDPGVVRRTRAAILREAILHFDPDLMIVDKRPAGIDGELLETIEALRRARRRTRLVLGIRDILDEPQQTHDRLVQSGVFETIDRYYDEVWIYGSPQIFDAVCEYRFPGSVVKKTRYCGYLKRPVAEISPSTGPPRVLVTTGGGGDGKSVFRAYLEGLSTLRPELRVRSTIVFGPHIGPTDRNGILTRFENLPDVTFLDFQPDLTPFYADADVVVSMAGYNAVCELLSFGHRAVLVPRATPVAEQIIRTRWLSKLNLFEVVEPDDLTPQILIEKVFKAIGSRPPRPSEVIDLEGLSRVVTRVRALLEGVVK